MPKTRKIIRLILLPLRLIRPALYLLLALYLIASLVVISDYFHREYGSYTKIICSIGVKQELQSQVVRIVGGYSEGSGFFVSPNQVLTNFHVIADEPSPKIIFPDGSFVTPESIVGDQELDLAVLTTPGIYYGSILPLPTSPIELIDDEPVLAIGYPMGTDLVGEATVMSGRFVTHRSSSQDIASYLQSDINLVGGMSGGPLTDQCGQVIGINTIGVAGLSLYIDAFQANILIPSFTDAEVEKLNVDPTLSPEDAVIALYSYIMARDMSSGFDLLSEEYLRKTDYVEWTSRFSDVLDIQVILTQLVEDDDDTVFVKFATKTWTGNEAITSYYEGVWVTTYEDDTHKMLRSMIKEVDDPSFDWYYSGPEF